MNSAGCLLYGLFEGTSVRVKDETSRQSDWIVDDGLPAAQLTLVTKAPRLRDPHASRSPLVHTRLAQLCDSEKHFRSDDVCCTAGNSLDFFIS